MPLPTHLPARPLVIGFAAVVGLGIAGALAAWLGPKPQPEIRTERKAESRTQTESTSTSELQETVKQLIVQNQTLTAQLQASTRQANDVNTRIERETIRYAPGPSSNTAPVVVVRDGQPQPMASASNGVPIEVVKEIITSLDKSRTETDSKSETVAKVDTKTETDATKTETAKTDTKTETEMSSSEKITIKPGEVPELPRFGVGYTSARQPFASYDLMHGPKLLGLDRVGAGALITKSNGGGIDFGPQANLRLGKGKISPFAGIGYKLRDREPVAFVGVKVPF